MIEEITIEELEERRRKAANRIEINRDEIVDIRYRINVAYDEINILDNHIEEATAISILNLRIKEMRKNG